ncbi:MAG: replication-associated recombination protein A [Myxococcota bacterium]
MSIPLATRLRPSSLDEIVGQAHLLAPKRPFRQALEGSFDSSVVFWGPPGTGKTTLAHLIANQSQRQFYQLSAVTDGLPALRKIIESAGNLKQMGVGSLLFVDEIHRWNKAQQDALLPHIENGLFLLVGATTENPAFSLNPALRSRCWLLELKSLTEDELKTALQRALSHPEGCNAEISEAGIDAIIEYASGDARRALSILERLSQGMTEIDAEQVHEAIQHKDLLHDSKGDAHHNVTSAFIKSMRGSNPDAALYWLARMLEGGEDPRFIARRMVIFASEDIGNADVRALPLATSTLQATQTIGMPEVRIILGQCCSFLASAPKSNAAYLGINDAIDFVRKTGPQPVPIHIGNPPVGYQYPHDFPHFITGQNYWPDTVNAQQFYNPTDHGDEKVIRARLQWWAQHIQARSSN